MDISKIYVAITIISILVSFISGVLFYKYYYKYRTFSDIKGTIRPAIDNIDGNVYLFLEIHTSIDDILNEEQVVFNVSKDIITQK